MWNCAEYGYTLTVNKKSDIYIFGVVILKLAADSRPTDPEFGVCNQTEKNNELHEMLDPKVVDFFKEEMAMVLKIELLCTGALPINRPSMKRVVDKLQEANPQDKVKATAKDGK
jgi:hypothetical protein